MEFFRDPKNQIYADMALRLGRILVQYENSRIDGEKFEATLCLSVLQTLLTHCQDYSMKAIDEYNYEDLFNRKFYDVDWGLDNECWKKNTFNEELSLGNFIRRMRNSLSHPTEIIINSQFPSTGYTTEKNINKQEITKLIFVNSPDTKNNKQKMLDKDILVNTLYKDGNPEKGLNSEFPKGTYYEKFDFNKQQKFRLMLDGEPFARISIIEMSVNQMLIFTKNLANFLAQPAEKPWDGRDILNVIAA